MISVFKNFYQKPLVLDFEKAVALNESRDLYKDKSVLEALKELYHGKCAYCEQKTDIGVGHYRPKSKYPFLENEWSNLLPICAECNKAKNAKFEIKGKPVNEKDFVTNSTNKQADSILLKKELPLMIHPEVDSPENHIIFTKDGLAIGRTERGRYTIDACDLNRNALIEARLKEIKELKTKLKRLVDEAFKEKWGYDLENIPKSFSTFFDAFYKKQNSDVPFSRVFQCLWENLEIIFETYNEEEQENALICKQLLIWQKIYLLKKHNIPTVGHDKLALLSFQLQNLEGIRNLSISGLPTTAQWIFLTGENSYGKTSVLKGIAAALVGDNLGSEEYRAKIEFCYPKSPRKGLKNADDYYFDVNEFVWQSDAHKPYTKIAVYGANRTSLSDRYKMEEDSILDNLLNKNVELLNFERYLRDIYNRFKPKYDAVVKTLIDLIPQLAEIKIDDSQEITKVKYIEYGNDGETKLPEVSFSQLATGIKSVLAMVGDMLCRFMVDSGVNDSKDIGGIAIIDELDIHLHPKWQRKLPTLLSEVFPNVLFIASTHSPIPLLGAPKNSVFLTVHRTLEEGITVERLFEIEKNIKNMLPNIVLTSDLFGLEELRSVANEDVSDIMTQNSDKEAKEFDRLKKSLRLNPIDDKEFLEQLKAKVIK